ncbi:MAG: hypothetical protein ABS46_01455 [Cytophagaceae bacterium SCN 52-12]|nr:MAG: hypothetical protein ABS46_01455 [Cytophagaceae bacterium SCN 52-12]
MSSRKAIYYWKCDRPSAFRTLNTSGISDDELRHIRDSLILLLRKRFGNRDFSLKPGGGQGNHLTFLAQSDKETCFIRIENGPESDHYMEVEARVLDAVRATGVPTPILYEVDSSRKEVPYSYQFLQHFEEPDLNQWYKTGRLNLRDVAREIGLSIAKWQSVRPAGFGPFDPEILKNQGVLEGYHSCYPNYFFLNLHRHLAFLVTNGILSEGESGEILATIDANRRLLDLDQGCLVHKDLALWNILGSTHEIKAFIDWDDTISGDPTDDLSLLACFHTEDVLDAAINGYTHILPLPENFFPRFWLHLLRNMIVKAVIRVGGGYFNRRADFFLIGSGTNGDSLRDLTRKRIRSAMRGLAGNKEILQL